MLKKSKNGENVGTLKNRIIRCTKLQSARKNLNNLTKRANVRFSFFILPLNFSPGDRLADKYN